MKSEQEKGSVTAGESRREGEALERKIVQPMVRIRWVRGASVSPVAIEEHWLNASDRHSEMSIIDRHPG